jgi:DNA-binding MarR family transcriptional regulator
MNYDPIDTEFLILENIYDSSEQQSPLRQRDLARIAGTSLGMTNSILKRMAKKGWIIIKRLNSRNIRYAITLEGVNEIVHRSYRYFKRTIKNVVFYKEKIDEAVLQAKNKKITAVILMGISDLEFIVEHSCLHYGLTFFKTTDIHADLSKIQETYPEYKELSEMKTLEVYSETVPAPGNPPVPEKSAKEPLYLSGLVLGKY